MRRIPSRLQPPPLPNPQSRSPLPNPQSRSPLPNLQSRSPIPNRLRQLVDKLRDLYTDNLRQSWAPQLLYHLNHETERLRAADRALGVPEVLEQPAGVRGSFDALCSAAIAAARAALNPEAVKAKAKACYAALQPRLEAFARRQVEGGPDLMVLLAEMREALREAEASFDGSVRSALEADASEFKVGRFVPFVNAVVSRLEAQKFVPEAHTERLQPMLRGVVTRKVVVTR